ncbi:MAG: thioredoxin-dependent thiol peroxidase [Deltaproteobacteria bacterium]|nr:thioredoxin-dependent thiol peroxidase [Deltaproteobacteria bacterium]
MGENKCHKTHLKEGEKAPNFTLTAHTGEKISPKQFHGKKVVLYFYPKDNTPGCTKEACGFRDEHEKIEGLRAVILGVSPDPLELHEKFVKHFNLPFKLLADDDQSVCKKYGVWAEKNMYGKKYWGVVRTTFVIDEGGVVEKIYHDVKPDIHANEVLEYLKKNA